MKRILPSLASVVALAVAGLIGLSQAQEPKAESNPNLVKISLETTKGPIELELDAGKAPLTVANFVKYVKAGHYNGLIFHRVIPGFMIQAGGFTPEMQEKRTGESIQNEAKNGLRNLRGSIAMARTPDPHSASAQFFINLKDNSFLDYPGSDGWGYCVFGKVTKGLETVDSIAQAETGRKGMHGDVPLDPIVIKSATVVEPGK